MAISGKSPLKFVHELQLALFKKLYLTLFIRNDKKFDFNPQVKALPPAPLFEPVLCLTEITLQ